MMLLIAALLAGASFLRAGRFDREEPARSVWLLAGLAAFIGWSIGNPWILLFLGILTANWWRDADSLARAPLWFIAVGCCAVYGLARGLVTPTAIQETLIVFAGYGTVLGLWSAYSLWRYPDVYDATWTWRGWRLGIWEAKRGLIEAGQLNHNHTQSLAALCTVACVGLTLLHSLWWSLLLGWCLLPILAVQYTMGFRQTWRKVTQGWVHLWHAGCAALMVEYGWWSLLLLGPYLAVGLLYLWLARRHLNWADSGRVHNWDVQLRHGWWRFGWKARFFGMGWRSWAVWNDRICQVRAALTGERPELLTSAHNEFVQVLFEHGILGLTAVLGFIASTLWRLSQGSAQDRILFCLDATLCSVATLNYPWTWYQMALTGAKAPPENRQARRARAAQGMAPPPRMVHRLGSPALVAMSLIMAVLGR